MIDIGCNLTHRRFRADLAEVLHRASEAGVDRMLVTGLSAEVSRQAERLAGARLAQLRSTAGVHPHNARTVNARTASELEALTHRPAVVAVGECGLDYDRDFSPRPVQRRAFEMQLELAAARRMPVFLHEREAQDDFLAILSRWRPKLVGGVVHCFTGQARALEAYLELGLHIGITGWITDARRGAHLVSLVPRIPADRLMIETDAPFLTPKGATARRNEPSFLPLVLRAVAAAAGKPSAQVAAETTAVAERLFGWPPARERAVGEG
ncbi:MAG: TatD family hydrolase [Myxococcales bacterium]|nr:TatD family hydrolase [Myxococcales bacterium]